MIMLRKMGIPEKRIRESPDRRRSREGPDPGLAMPIIQTRSLRMRVMPRKAMKKGTAVRAMADGSQRV